MLKKRTLDDVPALFELMVHPDVFPYVRLKAETLDECYFLTKQILEKEDNGEAISRTILNEQHQAIGTINLYDLDEHSGFLNTWIGEPYFGKGYSQISKELFFDELFIKTAIETVYLKIRKSNIRSIKSTVKLPYASFGNETYPNVYHKINENNEEFDLFVVEKEKYLTCKQYAEQNVDGTVVG